RDSKDVKLFAFLTAQLRSGRPECYPAQVTDVRNFGFFVDVRGLAMSGLVPLSTAEDDFFVFEPARNHLIGRRTRRIIRLGDRVTVQIAKVDTFKKQVDFRLASATGGRESSRAVALPSRRPQLLPTANPARRSRGSSRGPSRFQPRASGHHRRRSRTR